MFNKKTNVACARAQKEMLDLINVVPYLLVLTIITLLAFPGCKVKTEVKEVEPVFAVNAYQTTSSSLDDYLEFGGDVAAVSSVVVLPDTAGKISDIYVKLGDRVTKDQIIAAVNASRPGMVYSSSPVRAPVAGTISSFPGVVGTMVSQSSIIARISSTNELRIESSVAERFVSRIEMNQKATISFDAYPDEKFDAHVSEISPVLDNSTRTMSIKLAIDTKDTRIKAGMYARIHLITEHKSDVIVVPFAAVVVRNGENYVFAVNSDDVENKRVELRKIKLGIRVDDYQEVREGLSFNEQVVVKGQTLLNDGSKINVVSVVNAAANE